MHDLTGRCHCGNIRLSIRLSRAQGEYGPRACDCDFCRKHGAAYVSDRDGCLQIGIEDPSRISLYKQGNELAEMIVCARCGVLVGALFREDGALYATVNVRVVEGAGAFGTEQGISPKLLAADDKVSRWKKLWFRNVTLTSAATASN
jgi:hypothetical protein